MIQITTNEEGKVISMCGSARAGDIRKKGLIRASKEGKEK